MYNFLEDADTEQQFIESIKFANERISFFTTINHMYLVNKYKHDIQLLKSRFPEFLI